VTFKQNPLQILKPETFSGEIYPLVQKLCVLESLGVQMAILIDFSREFSKINGRDFIDLLLGCQPVKLLAVGGNFRCGYQLGTGVEEIQTLAEARGTAVWVAPPVLDEGQPVSSSRIRQALAEGRVPEAERLMGRKIETIPKDFEKRRCLISKNLTTEDTE
jgi:riboflavin kinase/FMN adenylyltransferase